MTDWISGDWESLWKFGDAMANLAQCVQQIGINIQTGMIELDASWSGNASDAAYRHFSDLAAATSGQQFAIAKTEESYHKAALGAWQLSNQLGNILQALADKAILGRDRCRGRHSPHRDWGGRRRRLRSGSAYRPRHVAAHQRRFRHHQHRRHGDPWSVGGVMDAAYQGGDLTSVPLPASAYSGRPRSVT